jgi:hypothetical protein
MDKRQAKEGSMKVFGLIPAGLLVVLALAVGSIVWSGTIVWGA